MAETIVAYTSEGADSFVVPEASTPVDMGTSVNIKIDVGLRTGLQYVYTIC
jgi:hypothetical protein